MEYLHFDIVYMCIYIYNTYSRFICIVGVSRQLHVIFPRETEIRILLDSLFKYDPMELLVCVSLPGCVGVHWVSRRTKQDLG